jgi:hypothetical protein
MSLLGGALELREPLLWKEPETLVQKRRGFPGLITSKSKLLMRHRGLYTLIARIHGST